MNCKVQHLAKNIRYRILNIEGETYILDMERSFWKLIFPFFFWMFPHPVFKVEDQSIVEQLKVQRAEKIGGSSLVSLAGIAYVLSTLLTPLTDYLEFPTSRLINVVFLVLAVMFIILLYFTVSHKRKKKLYYVVNLETLQKDKIWIRPMSIKQIFKVMFVYFWLLGIDLLGFLFYINSRNVIILIIASGLLFPFLLVSRITVEEGNTTVKFKKYKKAV